MYKHFLKHRIREVEWFLFLDIDEFLVFREDGSIGNFVAKRRDHADMIVLNGLIFGHAGYEQRPKGSVLRSYTRRSRDIDVHTKILTRASSLDVARYVGGNEPGFWHDWGFRGERLHRVVNAIGDDVSGYYASGYRSARAYLEHDDRMQRVMATAVIHHYKFRSEDDITRRLARGTAGDFRSQLAFKRVLDAGKIKEFLDEFSTVEDSCLRDYWRYAVDLARDTAIVARPDAPNIALGKPATQSSISPWSNGATVEADAAGVVGGTLTGNYNCHTNEEDGPWWQVDLQDVFEIAKIVVFARPGRQGCNLPLSVLSSLDGETWQLRAVRLDDMAFGGADGKPYHFELKEAVSARYIRVQFIGDGQLQLDEIEVFGAEETSPPPLPGRHLTTGALARLSDETHPALPRANINADGVLPRHRTAVVVCARWETDYIEEWLTYYQCIGYGHVYLYCNDDDPAALYEKALPFTTGTSPFVTFIHFKGQGLQYAMYMHFIANYAAEVAWVSFFDVDEFLRIAVGSRIDAFLTRFDNDVA